MCVCMYVLKCIVYHDAMEINLNLDDCRLNYFTIHLKSGMMTIAIVVQKRDSKQHEFENFN